MQTPRHITMNVSSPEPMIKQISLSVPSNKNKSEQKLTVTTKEIKLLLASINSQQVVQLTIIEILKEF